MYLSPEHELILCTNRRVIRLLVFWKRYDCINYDLLEIQLGGESNDFTYKHITKHSISSYFFRKIWSRVLTEIFELEV